jgi:hypothetical protein
MIAAIILTIGCKGQTPVKEKQQETVKTENIQSSYLPKHLTKQMFLDEIVDYKKPR